MSVPHAAAAGISQAQFLAAPRPRARVDLIHRRSASRCPHVPHATADAPPSLNSNVRVPSQLQRTVRGGAVVGLLRIEQDGAYAALLSHSGDSEPPKDSPDNGPGQNGISVGNGDATGAKSGAQTGGTKPQHSGQAARETTWLVAGVTRWRRQLDAIISTLLTGDRSVDDLDPAVRQVLRLATFEIVHADLPDHAISAHVDLCSAAGHRFAQGLVNATLRSLLRQRAAGTLQDVIPQLPPPYTGEVPEGRKALRQRARGIALATSHPTWLVSRWLKRFGEAGAVALCRHNNRGAPAYGLRVNRGRTDAAALLERLSEAGAAAEHSELMPDDFLRVTKGMQSVLRSGCVAEGHVSVQDEAAGLVVALAVRPHPHATLLDTCAAPGGKALFAAARMRAGVGSGADCAEGKGGGLVVAADISTSRLRLIDNAAQLWGLQEGVMTVAGDLRERSTTRGFDMGGVPPEALPRGAADGGAQQFDTVLVDAPCSGSGVLCKRADLRWQRAAADMPGLVELQRQLLAAALPCVRPGGALVYSTCSLEAEENEEQVAWLLREFPGVLEVEPIVEAGGERPGAGHGVVTEGGFLQCLPHVHGCDGSFAARLRVRAAA